MPGEVRWRCSRRGRSDRPGADVSGNFNGRWAFKASGARLSACRPASAWRADDLDRPHPTPGRRPAAG
jgi:hypothetical protein